MRGEPVDEPDLVVPGEPLLGVLRELHVVGRVGVDEVPLLERNLLEVHADEVPAREGSPVAREVARVRDPGVPAEGNVETSPPVEPAQAVVSRPVEVIEEPRRLAALLPAARQKRVESRAARVEHRLVILHRLRDHQTVLQAAIEGDDMRVDVVEQRAPRGEAQADREAAAEGLDEASLGVGRPEGTQVRHLPALPPRPLERRPRRYDGLGVSGAGVQGGRRTGRRVLALGSLEYWH